MTGAGYRGETGRLGEEAAARYLRRQGYRILVMDYRTRMGEIDIIAANADYIVFAEVKTRAEGSMILPRESVTRAKQRRLTLTAQLYLSENAGSAAGLQPRFDVLEVYAEPGSRFRVSRINHLSNAF